jgi:hypothetical protein
MKIFRRAAIVLSLLGTAPAIGTASSGCDASPAAHDDATGGPDGGDAPVALATCATSSNLVDQAVCPRLLADGCATLQPADATELCRRLFVDLTGTAPSGDEVASTCAGKSTDDVVTALMKTPAYLHHAEELWAEKLAYDPAQVDGHWLDDADRIVDELVTGLLTYDVFATRIVGHPVFGIGARLPRSDVLEDDARFYPQVAARATQLFLGRAPIAGEDVSLAKLFSFWKKKIVVLNGDYGRAEPIVDPSLCGPCESNALGATTRIELPLDHATPYADLVDLTSTAGGRQVRSPALRAELDKPGALLAAQRPFWTQGADLALAMYLGWWKSTVNLNGSMLPELQVALSEQLRATRSWPEMVRTILTSALYTRTNRLPGGADPKTVETSPPWCSGPMRILRPEAYVSSLGHLLGVRVGRCDHRTYEPRGVYYGDGSEGAFFPYALREDEASDAFVLGSADFHLTAAGAMGGCNAGAPRTEEATLAYVFGMAPAAAKICAASELVPANIPAYDGSEASLARLADQVSMRLRARATTAEERRAIADDAASCGPLCSSRELATTICTAIARSADFSTY